jgi:prepilin-type N-terminal cleavage/methylation domain-containing protein
MEQFFQDNHFYFQADPPASGPACADDNTGTYFNFSCPTLTATTYTLTATGKSSMTGFIYTVTEGNVKKTTGVRRRRLDDVRQLLGYQQGRWLLKALRGFSLIELIVGMVILGVLLAIAMPGLQQLAA